MKLVNVFDVNVREARQFASAQLPWDKIIQVNSVPPQRTPRLPVHGHSSTTGIPIEVYMPVQYKLRVTIHTTLILFQIVKLQVPILHGSPTGFV